MQGNVMQRNGRSRAWAYPALVQNAYTNAARGLFASFSSLWASLSASDIDSWRNTELSGDPNSLGVPQVMKGKRLYVSCNVNLSDIGASTISTAPTFVGVVNPTAITVTAASGTDTVTIVFAPTPVDASTDIKVFATPPLPISIKPRKNDYRFIGVLATATNSPFIASTMYIAKYGSIAGAAGKVIYLRLEGVNNTTGQKIIAGGNSAVVS